MNIFPIRNDDDCKRTLQEISKLMELQPEVGSRDFDRLDILATLVEAYETKNDPIDMDKTDPAETIRFHLDRVGWTQAELARRADIQQTHLSAVLNHRRSLSLSQIKKLSAIFEIPADWLIENEFQEDVSRPRHRA